MYAKCRGTFRGQYLLRHRLFSNAFISYGVNSDVVISGSYAYFVSLCHQQYNRYILCHYSHRSQGIGEKEYTGEDNIAHHNQYGFLGQTTPDLMWRWLQLILFIIIIWPFINLVFARLRYGLAQTVTSIHPRMAPTALLILWSS